MMDKYYDSVGQCVAENPSCTHVLKTGPEWNWDDDIRGKFAPAWVRYDNYHTTPSRLKGTYIMGDNAWVIECEINQAESAVQALRQAIQDCEEQGYRVMFGNTQITGALICSATHTVALVEE